MDAVWNVLLNLMFDDLLCIYVQLSNFLLPGNVLLNDNIYIVLQKGHSLYLSLI